MPAVDALWTGQPSGVLSPGDLPWLGERLDGRALAPPRALVPACVARDEQGLFITGDWIRPCVREVLMEDGFAAAARWARDLQGQQPAGELTIDAAGIGALDTLGCLALADLLAALDGQGVRARIIGMPSDSEDLFTLVRQNAQVERPQPPAFRLDDILAAFGRSVINLWGDLLGVVAMLGLALSAVGATLVRPKLWRINALVNQLDKSAFRAVPIIVLIQLVIGGIIAQQSAYQLRYFGAELFTVDLVAILVLREIGVLISAIMVAGRTGSAFTAEIGAMRMREEVDAMRVIGLDPVNVLVVPRVLGLVIALPLLTVIANAAALSGGILTLWLYSGIDPMVFIGRMHDAILLETVLVGLIKAPFMAVAIGCIACFEGFRVTGSTESLGQRVTAAVVKSIFAVIVMDGVFAIFFASIDF